MLLFLIAEVPNFATVEFYWLAIIDPHKAASCVEVDGPIIRHLCVHSVDSRPLLREEVVLEYVGPGVSRHVPFLSRRDLKPRAEAFFSIEE